MKNRFWQTNLSPFLAVGCLTALCALLSAKPGHAAILSASLSNSTIPFETIGTTGTNITYNVSVVSDVNLSIYRLADVSDIPGPDNQVLEIIRQNVNGSRTEWWEAFWLLGGDYGRQVGNYQVIITATEVSTGNDSTFVVPTLVQINSIDIHNVTVSPSLDGNNNPLFPFRITYKLAKPALATVLVKDKAGNIVRTLVTDAPQLSETNATQSINWDGLNDDNRPVALGLYDVVIDARDSNSGDVAITRTREIAVQSLATLGASIQTLFETNTYVYPNPVRNHSATFNLLAVRNNATITLAIYTLAGDLVRDETFSGLSTGNSVTFNWNGTNESGKKVARGLYYYVVREEDSEGTVQTVKKMAVIE